MGFRRPGVMRLLHLLFFGQRMGLRIPSKGFLSNEFTTAMAGPSRFFTLPRRSPDTPH